MFQIRELVLKGCYELKSKVLDDFRGKFVKIFHEDEFKMMGLETNFSEEYYSESKKNVIRGMHFQTPPMDHVKLVYCVEGSAIDAVVDLRVNSETYGQFTLFELSASKGNAIYIPKGMAHGFCVLSEKAIMVYKVSTIYSPENDTGIHWNSINIPWPTSSPIVSDRDQGLPPFNQFLSPFSCELNA